MKILLVNDYATPTGGVELLMLALRERLRQRGYDARIFASSARPIASESFADYECFGTTSRFRTLLQTANPSALWKFSQVLSAFRPDVVHLSMFLTQLSPLILPLLKGVPSVYHIQWYRPICPLGTKMLPDGRSCHMPAGLVCYRNQCLALRDWLPLMLQMKLWRRWRSAFTCLVASSETVRQRLIAEGLEPVELIMNGVPLRPLRPSLSSPPTIVFAGRLVREKGVDVLLRAFAQVVLDVPEVRLLVVGEGPERERLQKLVIELGLASRASLLGHLSREAVERVSSTAWVQAVPSRWAEPFGLVAAEAMMRGTAVVASNSGGLTEIVQNNKTGFLVPPGDSDALAQVLLRLLQNRTLAEQMGRAGREVALARFCEATYVDSFVSMYDRLCNRGVTSSGNKHQNSTTGDHRP